MQSNATMFQLSSELEIFNIWHAIFGISIFCLPNLVISIFCVSNFITLVFVIPNLGIYYFHIDRNAPCPPPQILHNHCLQFLLGVTVVPREIIDNGYAKLWSVNKMHYGLCQNGEFTSSACQILKCKYLAYEIIRHAKSWNFSIPHAIRGDARYTKSIYVLLSSTYTLLSRSIVWSLSGCLLCYCVRARDHCYVFLWRHSRLAIHLVYSAPAAKR